MPTRGRIVDFDLEVVAVDLDPVPLDEVLSFRAEHQADHRKYMSNLRAFCRDLSSIDSEPDRLRVLQDRRTELQEAADALKRQSWKSFKQPKNAAGFGLGLVGAGIGLATGGVPAAAVAAVGSQLVRLLPDRAPESVYSYLFAAQRALH
jgi:hypothetical protein